MSPEDQHLGFSSAGEDVSLSCGHLVSSCEPGRGSVATLKTLHSWWVPVISEYMDFHLRINTAWLYMPTLVIPWSSIFFPYFSFSHGDISNGKSHFLQTLMDAEAAAKAAAIQLMSFKNSMDDAVCVLQLAYHGFNTVIIIIIISFSLVIKDSGSSATDKHQRTRQRRLLLEKLEHFRRTNKSVRQILKQLQDLEVGFTL